MTAPSTYYPTVAALDAAYAAASAAGTPPAALLVTSPNNPLGIVYPPHVIATMLEWCDARGVNHRDGNFFSFESSYTWTLSLWKTRALSPFQECVCACRHTAALRLG